MIDTAETDVLILGAGGAGLCAALHAADASPKLRVTVVVKGLLVAVSSMIEIGD